MNKLKFLATIALTLALPLLWEGTLSAQPQARRQQQQQQQQKPASNANNLTTRAQISFPTAQSMSEDVVWRRDLYREINLADDANAGLYYPVQPQGSQMNLFTYMFKLMLSGQIKAYEYRLDGNESFTDSARIKPLRFLDDYHIFYERSSNGRIRLDNSDIPSAQVKRYYLKESSYYDQRSATFHTQVIALCPIMDRVEDDWGGAVQSYPLFWVKYSDLAPFLSKQTLMTSNVNNAATMSIDDFFNKTMYKGKIYKTVNMQGLMLSEYCDDDSAVMKEQLRIEQEIAQFEQNVWGQTEVQAADTTATAADKKQKKRNRRASSGSESTPAVSTSKPKPSKPSGGSGAAVTVRRQRH